MPVYGIINYKSVTTITSRNVPARPLPRFSVTRNWSAKFAKLTAIWISSFSKFVECSRRMRNLRGGEEGEKRAGGSRVAGCGICDRAREEKSLGAAGNGFRELSPARRRFPRAPDSRFCISFNFFRSIRRLDAQFLSFTSCNPRERVHRGKTRRYSSPSPVVSCNCYLLRMARRVLITEMLEWI